MENTHEHLEHIEHAQHAVHDQFNRNVAVTMAIVAAVLAAVTVLSHWAHNETLLKQMQATDEWNYYQAKNNRDRLYQGLLVIDEAMAKNPALDKERQEYHEQQRKEWGREVEKYKDDLPRHRNDAERLVQESHVSHQKSLRFDVGELFVELGLVLCSIAILTRRTAFWYSGIAAGAAGIAVAATSFFIGHS